MMRVARAAAAVALGLLLLATAVRADADYYAVLGINKEASTKAVKKVRTPASVILLTH
jgi:hypothetical protein